MQIFGNFILGVGNTFKRHISVILLGMKLYSFKEKPASLLFFFSVAIHDSRGGHRAPPSFPLTWFARTCAAPA